MALSSLFWATLIFYAFAKSPTLHVNVRGSNKIISKALAGPWSLRQPEGRGFCPDGTTCPIDEVCCTNSCCEQPYVNCGQDVRCLTDDGKMECERDGEVFPCTACPGGETGCGFEPFIRCPIDEDSDYCVTEDGFIACGENSKFGVLCNETIRSCCIEPLRCCPDSDECCTVEEGGIGVPEAIAPLLEGSPGVTPSPAAVASSVMTPSAVPFPSLHAVPSSLGFPSVSPIAPSASFSPDMIPSISSNPTAEPDTPFPSDGDFPFPTEETPGPEEVTSTPEHKETANFYNIYVQALEQGIIVD